jgi:chemotaxis protein MotB
MREGADRLRTRFRKEKTMAEKPEAAERKVIIKRVIDDDDHAPHGGAWKVAYADLMTAMMAFFLLMWLLSSVDQVQLKALADYFTPNSAKQERMGGEGLLWGESPSIEGIRGEPTDIPAEQSLEAGVVPDDAVGPDPVAGPPLIEARHADEIPDAPDRNPSDREPLDGELAEDAAAAMESARAALAAATEALEASQGDAAAAAASAAVRAALSAATEALETAASAVERGDATSNRDGVENAGLVLEAEQSQEDVMAELARLRALQQERADVLERIKTEIRNKLIADDVPELLDNLDFQLTSEGLLIQILDRDRQPLFASGSAALGESARTIVIAISGAVARLEYPVAISGHTDAVPYRGGADYTNWELSTDRANSTRRLMVRSGVVEGRLAEISGLGDTEPLVADDPFAAENRRINVLLKYPDPLLSFDRRIPPPR